jgi:hypothetical protein
MEKYIKEAERLKEEYSFYSKKLLNLLASEDGQRRSQSILLERMGRPLSEVEKTGIEKMLDILDIELRRIQSQKADACDEIDRLNEKLLEVMRRQREEMSRLNCRISVTKAQTAKLRSILGGVDRGAFREKLSLLSFSSAFAISGGPKKNPSTKDICMKLEGGSYASLERQFKIVRTYVLRTLRMDRRYRLGT